MQNSLRSRPVLLALMLAVLVGIVFSPVRGGAFLDWDDNRNVYSNDFLYPPSPSNVTYFWTHTSQNGYPTYRPFVYSVYALLTGIAPLNPPIRTPTGGFSPFNPVVFHTFNLLVHILNVWLVFALLRQVLEEDYAAAAGAALFGVHPVQVETVAWVTGLTDLLATGFSLLALLLFWNFVRGDSSRAKFGWYGAATLCYLLALFSKPTAVIVPVLALVVCVAVAKIPLKRALKMQLFWLAIAGAFVLLTRSAEPTQAGELSHWWQRPFVAGDAFAFYIGKLLAPLGLVPDYGRSPDHVIGQWWFYATGIVPLLLGFVVWRNRVRWPFIALGAALFALALLPVSGFVPFRFQYYSTVADRYLYLPMVGVALAFGSVCQMAAKKVWKVRAQAGMWAVVGAYAFLCLLQTFYWDNSFALFNRNLEVNPRSWMAHANLGVAYFAAQNNQEAITHLQQAVALHPSDFDVNRNLGHVLVAQQRFPEAVAPLQNAVALHPNDLNARLELCVSLLQSGQVPAAIAQSRTILGAVPNDPRSAIPAAYVLLQAKQPAEAAQAFRAILATQPNNQLAQAGLQQATGAK